LQQEFSGLQKELGFLQRELLFTQEYLWLMHRDLEPVQKRKPCYYPTKKAARSGQPFLYLIKLLQLSA
jgi:hypothetical protein